MGGGGEISFSNNPLNRLYGLSGAIVLDVPADFRLHGAYQLGAGQLRLTNEGTIETDLSGGALIDLTDGFGINFNTGSIRATSGAKMTFQNLTLDNTGGLIEAVAGSFVDLSNVTIIGGTLSDADGGGPGVLRNSSTCTLKDVTLNGPFLVPNGQVLHLQSSIQVLDSLHLQATANNTDIIVDSASFSFSGGGELVGGNSQLNRLYGAVGSSTIDIPADFHVHGALTLGAGQARLTNEGLIEAELSAGILMDLTDGAGNNFNSGTMRAKNGAKYTSSRVRSTSARPAARPT